MDKKFILVINAGSSSIKYKVFEADTDKDIASGQCEKIGNENGIFSLKCPSLSISYKEEMPIPNHATGIKKILDELLSKKVINSLSQIVGVGHRVVMGGKKYWTSTIMTEDAMQTIYNYIPLAPLHNKPEYETIREFEKLLPGVPNVGTFDTSFHASIPAVNHYALNKDVVEKHQIYRYGMHGTSYRFITKRLQDLLNKKDVNLIICHLGNGASITCVKNGTSYDTSMGFTPLEGLVMGTRCGDIDPSIALFLSRQGWTNDQIDDLFNKQSGLKGICGINDCRDIEEAIEKGDTNAKLAIDMFCTRVAKYIVMYANEIGRNIDGLVFTAGIGENSAHVVSTILDNIKILNLPYDKQKLADLSYKDYKIVSKDNSDFPIYVVRTNEELMIEQDVKELAKIK